MLDIMEDFMHLRDIPYARLDGSTRRPRRTLDIKLVSLLTDCVFAELTVMTLQFQLEKSRKTFAHPFPSK